LATNRCESILESIQCCMQVSGVLLLLPLLLLLLLLSARIVFFRAHSPVCVHAPHTEPMETSRANRERLTTLMFEKFQSPAYFVARSAVLSCFAAGRDKGLVVDCGASSTVACCVHDGFALRQSMFIILYIMCVGRVCGFLLSIRSPDPTTIANRCCSPPLLLNIVIIFQ
jgi:hypothetical protein